MSTTPATTTRPSPARRSRSPSRRSAPAVAAAVEHAISERALMDATIELMRLAGFTCIYHTHDSRRSEPGFPDVVAVNPRAGRVVFCEFKGERPGARVSEAQRTWLYALAQCPGVETYLFVPQDWRDGHIERLLLLGARQREKQSGQSSPVSRDRGEKRQPRGGPTTNDQPSDPHGGMWRHV